MFGVFRYLMAVLILAGHVLPSMPFHFDVAAFSALFLLSGYLTTYLIRNHYGHFGRTTGYFYLDRLLRLYPQFALFLLLTLAADFIWQLPENFFRGGATIPRVVLNALILPANYATFFPSLSVYLLIPALWSLALLAQVYGVFPILILRPWMNRSAALLSFLLFALSVFGGLDTDFFALRFLPGVIFIFIFGKSWAEFQLTGGREPLFLAAALYVGLIFLSIIVANTQFLEVPYNKEVLCGVILGFPVLVYLSRQSRKKWDEVLGRTAYGVFLSHALIFNLLIATQSLEGQSVWLLPVVTVLATVSGLLVYLFVEKYVDRLRYRVRQLHSRSIYDARPVAEE